MKRFFVFFISIVTAVILLPSVIVMIFSPFSDIAKESDAEYKTIHVLDKGEVKTEKLEDYLYGVLAGEMPASFHEEALKAQAVAARTYIINKCMGKNKDHPEADVCTDSTHCKAHLSDDEIAAELGEDWIKQYSGKLKKAVKDTSGEIIEYNGEPIEAVFHSCGSGVTENASDVWGGDVPYLKSVSSPGDVFSPKFSQDVSVSFDVFCSAVNSSSGINAAPYVGDVTKNESGSVKTANLGGAVFSGTEVRKMFSLPSANFTVEAFDNYFVFHCKGSGHGVGMSQYGAEYFAENGMNYKDILKTYYKDVEIVKQ